MAFGPLDQNKQKKVKNSNVKNIRTPNMSYEEHCHARLRNFCYMFVQVLQTWKEKREALKLFSAETDQKTKPLGRKRQREVGTSVELHLKGKGKT